MRELRTRIGSAELVGNLKSSRVSRAPDTLPRSHAAALKVLFVADLHYNLRQFDWVTAHAPEYDVAIIGGDLLDLSSPLDPDVQIAIIEKYLDRIRQKTRLLVSSGNHDGDSRNEADESVAEWLATARVEGLYIDGESVTVEDTLFTICPWWDGPVTREKLAALLERAAHGCTGRWIWIHHAPPNDSPTSWAGKKFGGDDFLRTWIEQYQPDIVLSGHIHNAPFYANGAWADRIGRTWVFNPGRQIGAQPTYLRLDLGAMTATWVSAEGELTRQLAAEER